MSRTFRCSPRGGSNPREQDRRRLTRLLRRLILVLLALALASAVPVGLLRWWNPPTSAFMLSAKLDAARARDRSYRTRYAWVDLEHISPDAALAVIASEDQDFPFHAGFDFRSIREAVRASERGKRLRGASTLTQQVAKNLFLWSGRSFVRKALEAWFTILIERLWPKERILEVYLNIVEFGRGLYGVQAASEAYFHEPAARLTREEAALLAAVLPNPHRLHVERPSLYVLARRDWILGQMRQLGGSAYLRTIEPAH
ncbi:MAG: monofunctional biosynthetic peptidoglycan transglycosylase [Steroidobacteraceae bacterium]